MNCSVTLIKTMALSSSPPYTFIPRNENLWLELEMGLAWLEW